MDTNVLACTQELPRWIKQCGEIDKIGCLSLLLLLNARPPCNFRSAFSLLNVTEINGFFSRNKLIFHEIFQAIKLKNTHS